MGGAWRLCITPLLCSFRPRATQVSLLISPHKLTTSIPFYIPSRLALMSAFPPPLTSTSSNHDHDHDSDSNSDSDSDDDTEALELAKTLTHLNESLSHLEADFITPLLAQSLADTLLTLPGELDKAKLNVGLGYVIHDLVWSKCHHTFPSYRITTRLLVSGHAPSSFIL